MTTKEAPVYLESPVGEIQFMALRNKVSENFDGTGEKVHTIRLIFTGTSAEDKAFKAAIEEINPKILGHKHAPDGGFTVNAATQYNVNVVDVNEELLETDEIPYFTKGTSTGKAKMVVSVYTKSKLGGSIKLSTVQILELEGGERQEAGPSGSALLDKLRKKAKENRAVQESGTETGV